MRKTLILSALAMANFGLFSPEAFAFAEVARGKLTATASVSYNYDNNVFSNSTEQSDYQITFNPSLNYRREVGRVGTTASLGVSTINFTDFTDQNAVDPTASLAFDYDGDILGDAKLSLSYARRSQANEILLTRTKSDEFRTVGSVNYFFSDKTGVRVTGNYRFSDYQTVGFGDVQAYGLGGGIVYRYSPKLNASLTYTYRPEQIRNQAAGTGNPDSTNHTVSLGLDGQITPKINGTVNLGVVTREFEVGGNATTMAVNVSLAWAMRQKTSVTLNLTNGFDTSGLAQSYEILGATLGVGQALTEKITLSARAGIQNSTFDASGITPARTDEAVLYGLQASYRMNDYISVNAGGAYRDSDSTRAAASYKRLSWTLGVTAGF